MSTLPLSGTANVENGSDVVEWIGDILTEYNCVAGGTTIIDGVAYYIEARIDTTSFRLLRDYAGSTASGVACDIGQFTPETVRVVTLHNLVAQYDARLAMLDAYGKGLFYTILSVTGANDPGPGKIARNYNNWSLVTQLYVDVLDAGGFIAEPLIELWKIGTVITVRSLETRAYASFMLTAAPAIQDTNEWFLIAVSYIGGDGELSDAEDVAIEWNRKGEGLEYDVAVTDDDELADWDEEDAGFRVLSKESGLWILDTPGDPGTWIGPIPVTGEPGADGIQSSNGSVEDVIKLTATEYAGLGSYDPKTVYIIPED